MIHLDLQALDLSIEYFTKNLENFAKNKNTPTIKSDSPFDVFSDMSRFLESLIFINETRFYCLNNTYLNGIQAGIQSAHGLSELTNKYLINNDKFKMNPILTSNPITNPTLISRYFPYTDKTHSDYLIALFSKCSYDDKTLVVLNGGDHKNLTDNYDRIESLSESIHIPFARFFESDGALNGALTNVAMCVSEVSYLRVSKEMVNTDEKVEKYLTEPNLFYTDLFSNRINKLIHQNKHLISDRLITTFLNAKKTTDFNDIVFLPIDNKVYLMTKYDLELTRFLNGFRLAS